MQARPPQASARNTSTKVAAKTVASNDAKKTASAKAATKPVSSKPVSSKPAPAKPVATKTSPTTDAPVVADQTANNRARDAATRDNKAKGIVAKENSAKSAAAKVVVDETSATKGEGRPAIKSVSGVKTSAAAFFAARQKMAPGKVPVRVVETKVADKANDVVEAKSVDATQSAPAASLGRSPEAAVAPGARAFAPVMEAQKAVGDSNTMVGAVKAPVKAPLPKGQGFKTLEYIVYPAHGVGQITAIEEQEVAGYKLELFVISFIKDKMILKVPLPKIASVGMRKLAEAPVVKRALDTLTGRARIKRTMWSRRAQEYEAKINSGDLVAIAEVVRDLYRSDAQPEQSYSERQLYEAALDRMAREIAVVQKLTDAEALKLIDDQLQKGPRRTKVEETEADEAEETDDGKIVEAA